MLRLLRDAIWQFWGVLIGVIGIALTLYSILYENTKALEIAILANVPLVEISPGATDKITVLYGTRPVGNPLLLQVRLENTGSETIREEDYARQISLVFPERSQILEASVIEAAPANIGMTIQIAGNAVTLSKTLLNSEDRLIIQILIADVGESAEKPFRLDARIAGVKDIPILSQSELSARPALFDRLGAIGVLVSILVLIGIFIAPMARYYRHIEIIRKQEEYIRQLEAALDEFTPEEPKSAESES